MIVFDIDGTLADATHRLHHIQKEPKDWETFYSLAPQDRPIWPVIDTMIALTDRHYIELWTGRRESLRAETERWLRSHIGEHYRTYPLRMRTEGDRREDYDVKREFIEKYGRPVLVFEDRTQVVQMYRSLGIRVAQVADGHY